MGLQLGDYSYRIGLFTQAESAREDDITGLIRLLVDVMHVVMSLVC
jgi:hypothetical protein